MKTTWFRIFAVITILSVLTGSAFFLMRGFTPEEEEAKAGDAEFPTALGQHIEDLYKAAPGMDSSREGSTSAAEDAFMARAFPADTISVDNMETARAAFSATQGRAFPRGKGRSGTWVSVGPSEALYPATPFRDSSSYVPADYVAGGRTTSIAISETCVPGDCRVYIATSGGGVWRTKNALDGQPNWVYLAGPLGINATGVVYLDPNDASGNTVYVGTGEANICGSGCVAGTGLYKSTNGGDTWSLVGGKTFNGLGLGTIAVRPGDPKTIYVGVTTALRGMSSTCCSGITRPIPGAGKWGLYKSTDAGATWAFIHNGSANAADCVGDLTEFTNGRTCSPRGVRRVALDPSDPGVVYASSFGRGVWRSGDGGATWVQIKTPLATIAQDRPEIAVTRLPNGDTRLYVAEGASGSPYSRLFRSDSVRTGAPVFLSLTSKNLADPGYGSYNYCGGQCWYDNFVVTPAGYPDMVYLGGSYAYGETGRISNGRGVVLSTDAGVSFTDMTMDATDALHPNGLHPDQHSLVTNPNNPNQFFETSDGGVMRSSGEFADISAFCDPRGLSGAALARCQQLLSRVPTRLESMNKGLSTLQFLSLSVSPDNANLLQGGTQDNGTWQSTGNPVKWENKMVGDGGQSGFDVSVKEFRFHNFYDASPDVNFSKGDIADWNWIADPIFGHAGTQFYVPMISDPVVSGTLFVGTGRSVFRTKTFGMGAMTLAEFRQHCNEWTGDFTVTCGDWEQLGATRLTSTAYGSRAGGAVAAVERTVADTSTAWAATTTGRVFVSTNVDADPASAVVWTRLDDKIAASPNRFVSSIYIDPADGNHAFISYSGYNVNTKATPGHVFEVTFDPAAGTSSWVDRSYDFGDLPANDLVRDDVTGDLYAATDFGVVMLPAGETHWVSAAPGMPEVEVSGLTIVPAARKLYAATHGLSAWLLNLP